AAQHRIHITHQVDIRAAHKGRGGTFADALQHQAGTRAIDPGPGEENQKVTEIRHQVRVEKKRANYRNLAEEWNWQRREKRPGQSHEWIAEEVGKVAADERQHEP